MTAACDLPPAGWACTRPLYHDGPCAAVPTEPWRSARNGALEVAVVVALGAVAVLGILGVFRLEFAWTLIWLGIALGVWTR